MPFSKNACQRLPISPKKAGDEEEDIFDRSVDVQVLRLRRKLEINPGAPRVIQTERCVGYVFALPVEPF